MPVVVFLDEDDAGVPLDGSGGWDPGSSLWVSGVDYLGAWRRAQDSADLLNGVVADRGLGDGEVRAVVVSLPDGSAAIDVRMSVRGAGVLVDALRQANERAA